MLTQYRLPLGIVIAMAPLAIGGTRADVQFVLASVIAGVALMAAFSPRLKDARTPWVKWLFFAAAAWSLFQLVPLPINIVSHLSPNAASLYLAADPSLEWAHLSVDFSRTAVTTLHLLSFGLVFIMASVSGRTSAPTVRWAVIAGATACVLVAILHWVFELHQIFGLYDALHRTELHGFFGPFVNENTFAGLLVLGGLLASGKLGASDSPVEQKLAGMCALLCTLGVVATGSRGALLALLIGWAVFVVLILANVRESGSTLTPRLNRLLIGGSVLLFTGGLFSLIAFDSWLGVLGDAILDDPKVRTWYSLGPLMDSYPWVGSGRGTFGLVFHQVQSQPIHGTVSHAENFLVQSLVESGLPATVLLLVIVGSVWIQGIRTTLTRTRPTAAASIAGVTAVAIQQFADFGLESMGLSLAVAASLGTVFTSRRAEPPGRSTRYGLVLCSGLMIGLAILAAPSIFSTQSDRYLEQLKTIPLQALQPSAQAAATAHPADPMVPLTVATRLAADSPTDLSELMKWSTHALRLAPQDGRIHLVLARALTRKRRYAQAAGEYRRALSKQPWASLTLLREIALKIPKVSHLAAVVRQDKISERRLFATLFALREHEKIGRLASEIVLMEPDHPDAPVYHARACLLLGKADCVVEQIKRIQDLGQGLIASSLEARLAAQDGQNDRARRLIEAGLNEGGQSHRFFLKNALRVAVDIEDEPLALKLIDHLWIQSEGRTLEATETLSLKGRAESKFKRYAQAVQAYDQASSLAPRPEFTLAAARNELALKREQDAIIRLRKAHQRWPAQPQIKTLLDRLLRTHNSKESKGNSQHD